MALSADESEKRARRRRLLAGIGLGAAAVGIPALVYRLKARKVPLLPAHGIGRSQRWRWGGVDVSLERGGSGHPLVLLHSLGPGHDGWQWRASASELLRHHEVTVPDLPGWGRTPAPDRELSPALYEDFLHDLLVHVVRAPATVLAVGRAAGYALGMASRHPELVRALGLIAPRGLGRLRPGRRAGDRLAHHLVDLPVLRPSALARVTSRSALRRHLETEVYAAPERVDAAVLDHYYVSSRQPGGDRALAALLTGKLDPDVSGSLGQPPVPVWLVWGRRAHAPSVETADLWLRRLPEARLEVFDRSGLLPHVEEARRFSRRFEDYLATLDAAAG